MGPDGDSHVREGVRPADGVGHGVVYPAVGPPVSQAAVVGHPRDKQVMSVALREDVAAPGGEVRGLAVALREGDGSLLQQGTSRA